MAKISAGLLIYRQSASGLEFLLAHPGGPLFARRDEGWWTIPKGEPGEGEDLLAAAIREFTEETGWTPSGPYLELRPVRQKGGKQVHCWACAGDFEPIEMKSNVFSMEWPPRSGRFREFEEIDKVEWFSVAEASVKINAAQVSFIEEVVSYKF
ncbi:NUDIX domain-containing protein [Pedobacter sp. SYP-B3415]|uniref:NUDIX domain-containing protein n=1 Tax=Pedobacter sp. SYP-B3415 TaxID=2496641 RepID=UPI00101C0231|nr:NUDIX domain-containing protein [Pedobacter sp. SYP-B3415]